MTRLILIRHGNTFEPGEKVVWAGARTDLPLARMGHAQAAALGQTLAKARFRPNRFLTGPLIRTRQHGDIIASHIGYKGQIDISEALREIDYGTWEGLSTEDIYKLGGQAQLQAWDEHATWPQMPGWHPAPEAITQSIKALLQDLAQMPEPQHMLLITSNGILRFFARLAENTPPADQLKVATGHYCIMVFENDAWHLRGWNISPETDICAF